MPKAKPTPTPTPKAATRAAPRVTYDPKARRATIHWEGRETILSNCTREGAREFAAKVAQHATPTGMLYTRPTGLAVTR